MTQTLRFNYNQEKPASWTKESKTGNMRPGTSSNIWEYTEEYIPTPQRKRKKGTKQPAALATIEVDENKEKENEEAIQELFSDITSERSDKDNETDSAAIL